jgi:hypothetical protein
MENQYYFIAFSEPGNSICGNLKVSKNGDDGFKIEFNHATLCLKIDDIRYIQDSNCRIYEKGRDSKTTIFSHF